MSRFLFRALPSKALRRRAFFQAESRRPASAILASAPPPSLQVGVGKVIRAWDAVLCEMSVGEKAEVKIIDPEWAYGAKGKPPVIPPNAGEYGTFRGPLLSPARPAGKKRGEEGAGAFSRTP